MAALTVDSQKRLVLRWTTFPHAIQLSPAPRGESVLLEGVDRIELRYWQTPRPSEAGGRVRPLDAATPPPLILVRLIFPPDSRLWWPDIAVAPRAERAEAAN